MRLGPAFAAGAAVLIAASARAASPAETLPAMRFETGDLVSPDQAKSQFGAAIAHTPTYTVAGSQTPMPEFAGRPPEIRELARALKNDPDLIYEYVRNQVKTEFAFGARKGALGALIDKSGTPFDQNMLLVETARAAGLNARYKIGKARLTAPQFADWTGVSDMKAACRMLAAGGIPAAFNATEQAPADCSLSGTFSTVTLLHIWSEVQIGTNWYAFDPSYKPLTPADPAPYDVAGGGNYAPGHAATAAQPDVAGDDHSGDATPYIRAADAVQLDTMLTNRSTALITDLIANRPEADMDQMVGIRDVSPVFKPAGGWRSASPPYEVVGGVVQITGEMPDQYRTTLEVKLHAGGLERFSRLLYTDEVYGRRIAIDTAFDNTFVQGVGGSYAYIDQFLTVDDVKLDRFACDYTGPEPQPNPCFASAAPGQVSLAVNHPYRAGGGTYGDQTVVKIIQRELPIAVVLGFGRVSPALLAKWSNERLDDKPLPFGGSPPFPCGPHPAGEPPELCRELPYKPAGDFKREKTGASWLAQFSRMLELQTALGGAVGEQHHTIGLVNSRYRFQGFQNDPKVSNSPNYYGVQDQFSDINVDSWITVSSLTASTTKLNAIKRSVALAAATLEGSIFEQMEDLADSASTASRFAWANRPKLDDANEPLGNVDEDPCWSGANLAGGPRRFYDFGAAPANRTSLLVYEGKPTNDGCGAGPQLPPSYTRPDWIGQLNELIGRYQAPAEGYRVVTSAESFLGPGARFGQPHVTQACLNTSGTNCIFIPGNEVSRQRGGAVVATKFAGPDTTSEVLRVAHVYSTQDGISKGGGGKEPEREATYDPKKAADILKDRFVDKSVALGVDLKTGVAGYTTPTLLSAGSGDTPYGLHYQLSFKAAPSGCTIKWGPCTGARQGGWTHNWDLRFSLSSSGLEAMGQSSPRAAAGSLISFIAMQDLFGSSLPEVKKDVFAALVADWWRRQMVGNTATITQGFSGRQYVRLPNGAWLPPTGSPGQLVQTGQRIKWRDRCFPEGTPLTPAVDPTSTSRRWANGAPGAPVSFTLTEADGRTLSVQPWEWAYLPYVNTCAMLYGFKVSKMTWPQGPVLEFVHDTPDPAIEAPLDHDPGRVLALNLKLDGANAARGLRVAELAESSADLALQAQSTLPALAPEAGQFGDLVKDATGASWRIELTAPVARSADTRPVPYPQLSRVFEPVNLAAPALHYVYDSQGRVKEASDATALQWGTRRPYRFFIAEGGRAERQDPGGAAADGSQDGAYVVDFDRDGDAVRHTDELGALVASSYDGLHRVKSRAYPEGDRDEFKYDLRDNVTELRRKAKPGSPLADIVVSASWNLDDARPWNAPDTITDANNNTTSFAYNESGAGRGLLKQVTRPAVDDGSGVARAPVYAFAYNLMGLLTREEDPTHVVTAHAYSPIGNRTSTTLGAEAVGSNPALNLTTQFQDYDGWGNAQTLLDPRGDAVTASFDALGRRLSEQRRDGGKSAVPLARSEWVYDGLGRVVEERRAAALNASGAATDWAVTRTDYTPTGRVWRVTDADGRVSLTQSDALDRTLQSADASGRAVRFEYDKAGRKLKEIRGWGTPAQVDYARWTYTDNGQVQTVKDAGGSQTRYIYDGFDRLSVTRFPDPTTGSANAQDNEQLTYDANGNVLTRKTRGGSVIEMDYDALNRLTGKDVPAWNGTARRYDRFRYDLSGRRVRAFRTGHELSWSYDAAGRVKSASASGPQWPSAKSLAYGYDAASNRTGLTWPDGYGITYGYDALGRMESVTEAGGALMASFTHDPLSRRTGLTYGTGGASVAATYTKAGDLTLLAHDLSGSANDVAYDAVAAGSFDRAHRLVKETVSSPNPAYRWSGSQLGAVTYQPDKLNRYLSYAPTGAPPQAFAYDANQNLTSDAAFAFAYDAENRLVSASSVLGAGAYSYDPLGRRESKTVDGTLTGFLSDGDEEIGDYDASGALTRRYVPGPETDRPIGYVTAGGTKRYVHADRRGSTIALTNGAGGLSEGPYAYDEYGRPSSAAGFAFKYTGRRYDPETGLHYYRARYYSTSPGRFLQTDPVGYDGGMNLYDYVEGDPVNRVDPRGLIGELYCWRTGYSCERPLEDSLTNNAQAAGFQMVAGLGMLLIPGPEELVIGGVLAKAATSPIVKAVVTGRAQQVFRRNGQSTGHAFRSAREAYEMLKSGAYDSIHLNRTLRSSTKGDIDSSLRPDVVGVRTNGKVDVREIASPGQRPADLAAKYQEALGDKAGDIRIVRPTCQTGTRIC